MAILLPHWIGTGDPIYGMPHYLNEAEVVHAAGNVPLLMIVTASTPGGNGDQIILRQVLAYDKTADSFSRIYKQETGRNRNEDVRFIESGKLKGDIISAVPTDDAPFGYWIVVNELTPRLSYRQVLRYRSATTYGDGNALPVVDSEMPNIERRLGIWREGMALPLPANGCAKSRMVRGELWCRPHGE